MTECLIEEKYKVKKIILKYSMLRKNLKFWIDNLYKKVRKNDKKVIEHFSRKKGGNSNQIVACRKI